MEENAKAKYSDVIIFVAVFLLTSSIPFSLVIPDSEIVYWLNIALRLAFFPFAIVFVQRRGLARPALAKPKRRTWLLLPFFLLCFSNFFVTGIQGLPSVEVPSPEPLLKDALLYLLVAVGEELVFRVVVYSECKKRLSLWKASLISALVFALPHLLNATSLETLGTSAIQTLYSFFLGLLLSIVYEGSGNILWAMVLHFLFDFVNGSLVSSLFPLPWDGVFYVTNLVISVALAVYFLLVRPALFRNEKPLP